MNTLQPSSRHCFVCGVENPLGLHLKFYDSEPGEVMTEYTVPEDYQGYPGVAHGGIVAAMLDEAAGRCLMGDMQAPRFMYTARLNITYRKNVPVGQPLRLVGKAGASRGRSATATSAIYDQAGNILAEAEALLINIPKQVLQNVDLSQLGWQIYPEELASST
jgi:acyl-coenzyme A thioesterase PaaI-like protein